MKTAEKRAIEIVDDMSGKITIPEYLIDPLIGRFALAIKDIDKITRHACAEKVSESAISPCEHNSKIRVIDADEAYTAIMNTKTV